MIFTFPYPRWVRRKEKIVPGITGGSAEQYDIRMAWTRLNIGSGFSTGGSFDSIALR